MDHNITSLIDTQVSEYVKATYPLFSEFLKKYFEYAQQKNNFNQIVNEHQKINDVDLAPDEILDKLYTTYAQYLPKEIVFDKRNCIKILNEIYNAKGTEKALKLLFNLIFGREINVVYPGQFMLRASDGNWSQERFLVLKTLSASNFGLLDIYNDVGTILQFNDDRNKYIKITRIVEQIENDKTLLKIFFVTPQNIKFTVGDILLKRVDDVVVYAGEITSTLVGVKIDEPGRSWMRGQIFKIRGTVKDTTVKVLNTKEYGKMSTAVITDFGYTHAQDQTILISSYKLKPIGTTYNRTDVITGPGITLITLDITDKITDFSESLIGFSDGVFDNKDIGYTYTPQGKYNTSYVKDESGNPVPVPLRPSPNDVDYAAKMVIYDSFIDKIDDTFYTGVKVIDVNIYTNGILIDYSDSGLSMDDWLLSRAKVSCVFGPEGRTYGVYKDSSGHPSNDIIRLQDNLYYQVFSYLIETDTDISAYKEMLHITHPAGTVRFSTLEKQYTNNFSVNARAYTSYITNDVYMDIVDIDFVDATTDFVSLEFDKNIYNDSLSILEIIEITLNKFITDGISIDSSETATKTSGSMYISDVSNYFEETYVSPFTQLDIGQ